MKKRYQYWSSTGIQWTPWFECQYANEDIQMKGRVNLMNEYKD